MLLGVWRTWFSGLTSSSFYLMQPYNRWAGDTSTGVTQDPHPQMPARDTVALAHLSKPAQGCGASPNSAQQQGLATSETPPTRRSDFQPPHPKAPRDQCEWLVSSPPGHDKRTRRGWNRCGKDRTSVLASPTQSGDVWQPRAPQLLGPPHPVQSKDPVASERAGCMPSAHTPPPHIHPLSRCL